MNERSQTPETGGQEERRLPPSGGIEDAAGAHQAPADLDASVLPDGPEEADDPAGSDEFDHRLPAPGRRRRMTKKKAVILAAVLVVLALAGWRLLSGGGQAPAAAGGGLAAERTVTLQRTTLNDSITVTGTVQSGSTANVTTQLTAPVEEILVQVGDTVQQGDVIARLDSSDLEKQLAKLQESAADETESAQTSYDRAVKTLADAQASLATAQSTYAAAAADLETKRAAYQTASASVQAFQNTYDVALAAEQQAGTSLNTVQGSRDVAAVQLANAQAALAAAADDTARAAAQAQIDAANAAIAQADSQLPALQSAYENAVAVRENAESQLNTAKQNCNYDSLYQAYSAADTACQQAKTAYDQADSAVTQAQTSLETAQDLLENGSASDQIEELTEQIADCTLTASASGTITSIGATVGSAANQATVATIQDTDHLKVAVTIDEDDIKRVAVGQKAVIKSDATGEEEIAGTVTQVSLTASSGTGGSSGGFAAEVTVDGEDSGLLVGLSAQAEIIFTQADDVYTVPYDAVTQDESGQDVIYVRESEQDEWTAVPVTVGMETDYYVAVSGEGLSDGLQVLASAGDTAAGSYNPNGAGSADSAVDPLNESITFEMEGAAPAAPAGGPGGGGGGPMGG